jgi:hypothetical protein
MSLDVWRSAMSLDQLVTDGDRNGLGPAMNAELGQDMLDVLPDGLRGYEELRRDLGLAQPVDQE